MDSAESLKHALFLGQDSKIEALIAANPDLPRANFGLMCALYDVDGVKAALEKDPSIALKKIGPRTPILHLSFSRHHQGAGDEKDMIAVARCLIEAGADVNDGYPADPGSPHKLSALYGAIGHADNPILGRFLLEAGADPNDNESLYHSTELSHSHSLRLLLEFCANPKGTNALLRALDFDNFEMVAMLLAGGADPNEGASDHPAGQAVSVISALHQAARRMCGSEVTELLVAAGGDIEARFQGISPFALARIHGNSEVCQVLVDAGAKQTLNDPETLLVAAAEGSSLPEDHVDEAKLPKEYQLLLCRLATRDDSLDHIRRLVALGLEPDRRDEMGLTPDHLAGWDGRADHLAYFLSFVPGTEAKNAYGGTLLSTILHGAQSAPRHECQDYESCVRYALEAGAEVLPEFLDNPQADGLTDILKSWKAG